MEGRRNSWTVLPSTQGQSKTITYNVEREPEMLEISAVAVDKVQVMVDGQMFLVDAANLREKTGVKSYYAKGGYSCSFRVPKVNGKGEMENQTIHFEPMGGMKVRNPMDPNNVHAPFQYHTNDPVEQAVLDWKVKNKVVMGQEEFREYMASVDLSMNPTRAAAIAAENNELMGEVERLKAQLAEKNSGQQAQPQGKR